MPHSLLLLRCPCVFPSFSALIKGGGEVGGRGARFPEGNCFDPLILPDAKFFSAFIHSKTHSSSCPPPTLSPPFTPYTFFFFCRGGGEGRGGRQSGGHGLTCGHASPCCFIVKGCLLEGKEMWSRDGAAEAQLALPALPSSCGAGGGSLWWLRFHR